MEKNSTTSNLVGTIQAAEELGEEASPSIAEVADSTHNSASSDLIPPVLTFESTDQQGVGYTTAVAGERSPALALAIAQDPTLALALALAHMLISRS